MRCNAGEPGDRGWTERGRTGEREGREREYRERWEILHGQSTLVL